MSNILLGSRVVFACVAAIAGIFTAVFGQALWQNIVYPITKRGRKPNPRPLRLWLAFIFSAFITVICGALATVVPVEDSPPPTQIAWVYVTAIAQPQISNTEPSNNNNEVDANCFDTGNYVTAVAWVNNDNTLATASGTSIRIWRIPDSVLLRTMSPEVGFLENLAISPAGNEFVTAEEYLPDSTGHIVVYDTSSGLIKFDNNIEAPISSDPIEHARNPVAFSPDGKIFGGAANDGMAYIWNLSDGSLLHSLSHRKGRPVWALAFSPDSQILATGGDDNKIRLWSVYNGQLLSTFDSLDIVAAMAFSPDGKMLAAGGVNGPIGLWQISDGTLLKTLEGNLDTVLSISWSPDGKTLASGGKDNNVRLWYPSTGEQILTLERHITLVSSVAFSPNGKILASGSFDDKVCLWEITP